MKQNIREHQTQNFRRISPLGITLLKNHIRVGHAGTVDHPVDFSIPYFFKYKKEMDRSNKNIKILYKCITANTSAIWQHAAHATDQLTSPGCWTVAIQKSLSFNEKYWKKFWKKKVRKMLVSCCFEPSQPQRITSGLIRRMDQQAERIKTERVTGLDRRTREEVAKWDQMTALRFQTGGRHQISPASLRGC